MTLRKIPSTFLIFLTLSAACAYAKKVPKYEQARALTPEQAALVQEAIGREKVLIKEIQQRTPLVETYIQDTRPDVKLYEVPVDDQYMLSRVDFGKGFFDKSYTPASRTNGAKKSFFKGSLASITGLTKALGLEKFTYNPNGFMQMMFVDPSGFDTNHYDFSYVRREFLGTVRTAVFDVHPKQDVRGMGRFYGRIWVEDDGGNIVRFNGTYTGPTNEDSSKYFFHFDSWRLNVQPGIWLPVAIYVEESQRIEGQKSVGLKAQTHFWGYSLKLPTRDSENVSVKVDDAVDKSERLAGCGSAAGLAHVGHAGGKQRDRSPGGSRPGSACYARRLRRQDPRPDCHQPGGAEQPGLHRPDSLPRAAHRHHRSHHCGQHHPGEQGIAGQPAE